jgi:hypothetical protein
LSGGGLAFLAADIAPMSSRRFVISTGEAEKAGDAKAAATSVENADIFVKIDPANGNVCGLVRKSDGHNFVDEKSPGLNEYIYVEGTRFDAPKKVSASPKITIIDSGPLVATLLIESDAPGCNKLSREVRLYSGADHVELSDLLAKSRANVKAGSAGGNPQDPNNGKEAVHFAFPFNVPNGEIRMDLPWAVVQPEKDQIPGSCKNWFTVQRFVDISNGDKGVTWSPIDTPLVEVGGITATLIGSQTNPDAWQKTVEPSQALYSWAMNNYWHTNYRAYQEGLTTFRYAVRPHGAYSAGDAQRFGIECSVPLTVAPAADRDPVVAPLPKLDTNDVIVTAFKPADDGKGYILRLFAATGKDADVNLVWTGKTPAAIYQSDTLESRGDKIAGPLHMPAWGVATIRVE